MSCIHSSSQIHRDFSLPAPSAAAQSQRPPRVDQRPLTITARPEVYQTLGSRAAAFFEAISYPFKVTLSYLVQFRLFYYLTYPIWFIWDHCVDLYDSIYYRVENASSPRVTDFSEESIDQMRQTYWALGQQKWKEGVDGIHQRYGRRVFDHGLHGGTAEPGFIRSWERAAHFLGNHLGERLTPELFLQTHKLVTAHFLHGHNNTLFGSEQCGTFRTGEESLGWRIRPSSGYTISAEAVEEVDRRLCEYGPLLEDGSRWVYYHRMPEEMVSNYFSTFLGEFYSSMDAIPTEDLPLETIQDQMLTHIAKFIQRLEWLHAVPDGSGRTNILILNFLLTEYGMHPTILRLPYMADVSSLSVWKEAIQEGLLQWEREVRGC